MRTRPTLQRILARKRYYGQSRRVTVRLPETIPPEAVFPWIRRCCVDKVLEKAFPGLEPADLVQHFEGFKQVDGIRAAVYSVRVE